MTKDQALNYLKSSGFSKEQIQAIVEALGGLEIPTGSTTKNDDLALIRTWGLDEEIRCTMCTNSMKSDRGCDGGCVVNNAMYKEVMDVIENHIVDTDKMVEPTIKNDLEVDCNNCKNNFHRGDGTSYCATGDGMCHYECEETILDKIDEIITDALDKSTDQKESQTLRWVLDKISEVM